MARPIDARRRGKTKSARLVLVHVSGWLQASLKVKPGVMVDDTKADKQGACHKCTNKTGASENLIDGSQSQNEHVEKERGFVLIFFSSCSWLARATRGLLASGMFHHSARTLRTFFWSLSWTNESGVKSRESIVCGIAMMPERTFLSAVCSARVRQRWQVVQFCPPN